MVSPTRRTKRIIIFHVICWLFYISYELLFLIFLYHIKSPFSNYAFFYGCNIMLFYWHFHTLNCYLNRTPSRYWLMSLMILTEMAVIMIIKISRDYFFMLNTLPDKQFWVQLKQTSGLDFNRTIQYLFFSTVIWSAVNFGRFRRHTAEALLKSALTDKANTELKYQFAEAQNAFLKQQINPHLLFNTLNAIYSTVYQHSPEDSRSVLLLSDIMRYSFKDPGPGGRVPLAEEIRQVENLIDLNSFRYHHMIRPDFRVTGEAGAHTIIPLVLITLTENMFKHGDLRLSPHAVEITISKGGQLRYVTQNVPKVLRPAEPGSHVGLKNTRLRLDYAYPDNYRLELTETTELFTLELHINLAYDGSNH